MKMKVLLTVFAVLILVNFDACKNYPQPIKPDISFIVDTWNVISLLEMGNFYFYSLTLLFGAIGMLSTGNAPNQKQNNPSRATFGKRSFVKSLLHEDSLERIQGKLLRFGKAIVIC